MLALADFLSIAFLFGFAQIALTLANLFPLFSDFLLVIGFELTVATVGLNFTQRLIEAINTVLIVMFLGIANLPLDILLFFLTGEMAKALELSEVKTRIKAMRCFMDATFHCVRAYP